MATPGQRKKEYNRKWMAASRALQRMRKESDSSDDDGSGINNVPADNAVIYGPPVEHFPEQNVMAGADDLPQGVPPNNDSEDSADDQWD